MFALRLSALPRAMPPHSLPSTVNAQPDGLTYHFLVISHVPDAGCSTPLEKPKEEKEENI